VALRLRLLANRLAAWRLPRPATRRTVRPLPPAVHSPGSFVCLTGTAGTAMAVGRCTAAASAVTHPTGAIRAIAGATTPAVVCPNTTALTSRARLPRRPACPRHRESSSHRERFGGRPPLPAAADGCHERLARPAASGYHGRLVRPCALLLRIALAAYTGIPTRPREADLRRTQPTARRGVAGPFRPTAGRWRTIARWTIANRLQAAPVRGSRGCCGCSRSNLAPPSGC
jgi:hypothetical protein